jgi:hypothetical protein
MTSSELDFGLHENSSFYESLIEIQLVFKSMFCVIITQAILLKTLLPEELARSNPHCLRNNAASLNLKKKLCHSNILQHFKLGGASPL